ncbi:MAG TPA: GGDEF domain-containing protein [Acidobacteriaceae bacterium]|nr:GGDEF domain-containing protein [Acidobacteriaceae bacterium]
MLARALVFLEAVLSLTVRHSYSLTLAGDLAQCLLLASLLVCVAGNAKTNDQRARLFWGLLALGCGLWLSAQILWTYFEVFLRREVPNPFLGDVILFLHLVPMMGALAMQPHREREEQIGGLGALDFALLVIWWLYLYLFVVIPWQYVWPDEIQYGRGFDLVYFMEHFVFLACAGAVWRRSAGPWKIIYGHLFGAGLLYALGSVAASIAIDFGNYYTGSFYDIPLVAAMAWFAGMGMLASKLTLRPEPVKALQERHDVWVSGLAMFTLLSLPAMAGWAVFAGQVPSQVRGFRLVLTLITMMLMGGLAWIKQHRLDKKLARANRELREDSLTDLLTGARNRRFLHTTVEGDVRQVLRSYSATAASQSKRNRDLIFYLIDTDSFKEVNDRHGHDIGDKLLVEIARRISSAIRHSDVLIRWGGDEFLVASRYTEREEGLSLPTRVLHALGDEAIELEDGVTVRCTCSIGWAVFPWFTRAPEAVSCDDVLRLADHALYEAKKAGRNQAVGMLPSRDEPAPSMGTTLGGKQDRFAEHLAAKLVTIAGPQKAFAAGQGI